ncbi:MAG: ASPIC/UnbV domain-containing protein [Acidobacteriota bacterium]
MDLDNDGAEDIFVANGHVYPRVEEVGPASTYRQRNQVFWNLGSGQFQEARFSSDDGMQQIASSRGGAFGDIDDDGDIDIVIVNIDGAPSLLRNELPAGGNWIALRLIGTVSNRDAIGARVALRNGERRHVKEVHPSGSVFSSNDLRIHFGLGDQEVADEILIRWPSGREQTLVEIQQGSALTVKEGREPFLLSKGVR